MKRIIGVLLTSFTLIAFASLAYAQPWYAKGDYYDGGAGLWGYNTGNQLFDDGTNGDAVSGDGIYTGTVTSDQATAGQHQYKIANADWSTSFPGCNTWVYTSGSGDVIQFTFDTNVYNDGWVPSTNILWSDHFAPPGTNFELMGSAPETGSWTTPVAAKKYGDIWVTRVVIATPGAYEAKFRAVGTWDVCSVGSETNTPCGGNLSYTTTAANQSVLLEFNAATGRARATVDPPLPAASPILIGLLALALAGFGYVAIRKVRGPQSA